MLPIVNKPLLQYGVEEALDAGMLNCLVTGRGKRAITDHFDLNYELEAEIAGSSKEKYLGIRNVIDRSVFTMVRQHAMKGLEHAILTGEPLIETSLSVCCLPMISALTGVTGCWLKCRNSRLIGARSLP